MTMKYGSLEAKQESTGIWRVVDRSTNLEMYAPNQNWVALLFARARKYK